MVKKINYNPLFNNFNNFIYYILFIKISFMKGKDVTVIVLLYLAQHYPYFLT